MAPTTATPMATPATATPAVELTSVGLRDRKKAQTREAFIDIAAAVGVSARTFYRYFARKEDVVLADGIERAERLRAGLAAQTGAASPLTALRAAIDQSVLGHRTPPEGAQAWRRLRLQRRVISATPSLRALNAAVHESWVSVVATHAAEMVGEEPTDRWPALFGRCSVAAIATAIERWGADPTIVLSEECDAVLALLQPIDRPSVLDPRRRSLAPAPAGVAAGTTRGRR